MARLVELGWSIARYAWPQMLGATAVILLPAYAISVPLSVTFSPPIDRWVADAQSAAQQNLPQPALPDDFSTAVVALIAGTLIVLVASLIASAAIVHVVNGTYRGQRPGAFEAARFGLSRLGAMVSAQILYFVGIAIIVMIGLMLSGALLVGGGLFAFLGLVALVGSVAAILFVVVRAALLVQPIAIENAGGSVGFGRSWKLVSGAGWRVLGYLILLALVNLLISLLIGSVPIALLGIATGSTADIVVRLIAQTGLAIVTAPISPIVLTLLYFDLRWQHGERVPLPGGSEIDGRPQPSSMPTNPR